MTSKEYDIVALTEDTTSTHLEPQKAIALRRGQVGTVLTDFDQEAFLIDFADSKGQTYAMETIPAAQLMLLLHEPVMTTA